MAPDWLRPLGLAGLCLAGICLPRPAMAEPYELSDCPEVTVVLEDPVEPNGTVGPRVAELACRKLRELAPKFGLALDGEPMVRLMIADDPEAFRQHTGRGGWTEAVYSRRTGIITQPAKVIRRMARSRRLSGLLAHELTHYLIDRTAGANCPTWLHEGLAQHFEGRPARPGGPRTPADLATLELAWRAQKTPAQTAWCYRQSQALTERLIQATGEQALLAALPSLAETPDPLALPVADRPLGVWLFGQAAARPADQPGPAGQIEIIHGTEPGTAGTEPDGLTPLPLEEMLKKADRKPK